MFSPSVMHMLIFDCSMGCFKCYVNKTRAVAHWRGTIEPCAHKHDLAIRRHQYEGRKMHKFASFTPTITYTIRLIIPLISWSFPSCSQCNMLCAIAPLWINYSIDRFICSFCSLFSKLLLFISVQPTKLHFLNEFDKCVLFSRSIFTPFT